MAQLRINTGRRLTLSPRLCQGGCETHEPRACSRCTVNSAKSEHKRQSTVIMCWFSPIFALSPHVPFQLRISSTEGSGLSLTCHFLSMIMTSMVFPSRKTRVWVFSLRHVICTQPSATLAKPVGRDLDGSKSPGHARIHMAAFGDRKIE